MRFDSNEFADRGFATVAIDWCGQGLADWLLSDRRIGHIQKFPDYQHYVAAMMDVVKALDIPGPFHLIGHSIGGAIRLRVVYKGLFVQTCVFTGPICGTSRCRRHCAPWVSYCRHSPSLWGPAVISRRPRAMRTT
ncbi:MAG: alpha/beta fold hydrolase [Rhodobacteraceae bacterium]|nr:alpha/beta fold hydrolase [Paracoccaceae bacterium]